MYAASSGPLVHRRGIEVGRRLEVPATGPLDPAGPRRRHHADEPAGAGAGVSVDGDGSWLCGRVLIHYNET